MPRTRNDLDPVLLEPLLAVGDRAPDLAHKVELAQVLRAGGPQRGLQLDHFLIGHLSAARQAIGEAQAVERMRTQLEGKAYVERYVHTLTHELKSPLAAIRGASELLQGDDMPADQRARFAGNIERESERLQQMIERLRNSAVRGVLVGRGALRNPWIFEQAANLAAGRTPREISPAERAQFLLDYVDLLLKEHSSEAAGFRHVAPGQAPVTDIPARGRERWVINKLRALNSWYTKGLDNGSHLRVAINAAESIAQLREIIAQFFLAEPVSATS